MDPELARLRRHTADRIAQLATLTPGPSLVSALTRLQCQAMDAPTAVEVLALWGKVASWVSARQMIATHEALTGIRGPIDMPAGEAAMLAAQEIACATHIPYPTAMSHVLLVERIANVQPASWMAMDRGEVSLAHVKAVEKATRHCTPRVAQAVDEQVIPLTVARNWTPSETGRAARKLVIALDPKGAEDRAAAAKAESDVQLYPQPDEVATLTATGDAARSMEMYGLINDRAEAMGRSGDTRPVGLRRFDAMYDLITGAAERSMAGAGNAPRRSRAVTLLRMDLTTYLGFNDNPAELDGYGPITAQAARLIAADSTLRRMITDPLTGDCIDLKAFTSLSEAKVSYLSSDGAAAEYSRSDVKSVPNGHATVAERMLRRCAPRTRRHRGGARMHHQLKTKKLWSVNLNPDGSETWTSYLGFTHTKKPSYFPLPEPLPADDEPPGEVVDRLPQTFDPDPPFPDESFPEPPELDEEQYEAMEHAIDSLAAFGMSFRDWCNRYYDEARATGLVA